MPQQHTNALINETSPYLLQHAHNPVNWMAWNEASLNVAKSENKLIIVSIGYAACHWCHVMEHESFENEQVADVMNSHFVNIKVDREERPDIDQVYMSAVQLMTGQGGWPLNVVALPDGRPVWGGTYFKKEQWTSALLQIQKLYQENPAKLEDYASKLSTGIASMDIVKLNEDNSTIDYNTIGASLNKWEPSFDYKWGGMQRAPKFMMPNNIDFLLQEAYQNNNSQLKTYVHTTLESMANGGIYDQIGGGFSRYSVDDKWHIPHFEKMLYDNGQLVSLYARAYKASKNQQYKTVIIETLNFIDRELKGIQNNFYSSLDADSINNQNELEEGAFYVWTKNELELLLGSDFELFSKYFNINSFGKWEKENYVLIKTNSDSEFCEHESISEETFQEKLKNWKQLLFEARQKRPAPRLDDKTITSWNALMANGYLDAYEALGEKKYLETGIANLEFILNQQRQEDGGLYRNFKNGKSNINAYLEDYAATISTCIKAYQLTMKESYLSEAKQLTNYCFDHFYDAQNKMFYFTSNLDPKLIARQMEYRDNVIPASNSVMAHNLFKLGKYFEHSHYKSVSEQMYKNISSEITDYPSGYSNWLSLNLKYSKPFYEIAVSGENADSLIPQLKQQFLPNTIIAGSKTESQLPLLKNRFVKNETYIYVCVNNSCKLPVKTITETLGLIQ
ncbi:MAG: thioredoxin domain-containing protein [Bacteroidetes bacterium MedPE-SWsnd-G2]|nr:MAG: thioredoxin domain-containing protein [Bacteroidetes bacterium MedPE-SWsnd-G2]